MYCMNDLIKAAEASHAKAPKPRKVGFLARIAGWLGALLPLGLATRK